MGTLAIIGAMVGTLQGGLYRAIQAMFAASEKGVWYDPSDMQTLFQDSAGTTPVTAAGQPVGRMLDKSQGLVLGPELVDTMNTAAAWTRHGTNIIEQDVDAVKITFVDADAGAFSYFGAIYGLNSNLTVGAFYEVNYEVKINSGSCNVLLNNPGANVSTAVTSTSYIPQQFIFKANLAANDYIQFGNLSAGEIVWIRNISVRELPGYHATQSTSTARPVLGREPIGGRRNLLTYTEDFSAWSLYGGASFIGANVAAAPNGSMTADAIRVTTAGTGSNVYKQFTLAAGTYSFGVYVKRNAASDQTFQLFQNIGGTPTPSGNLVATDTWQLFTFAATGPAGTSVPGIIGNTTGTQADLLVWGAQLELGSAPTAYQKVVSALDVTEAGVNDAYYFDTDGVDDATIQSAGGGGSTGFFLCAAVHIDALGAAKTIWSDAGTNTGYILRINASNQLELAAGNGTAYTLAATTDTLAINTAYVVTAWDDGTNLNVQINSGTAGTAARPVVSAGTATATLGKDNGAATGFFNGAIFPLIYVRNGENVDAADRTAAKAYVASKAGITL